MNKNLSLGVLGHVDHGKTSLVKALTGIDTDRLKEEKERGLSIVLGFSFMQTKHGVIDLIDAPGHESFVRTMVSGATGVNGIILTIAANEGIQQQTYEHFNIAKLLNIDTGLIVITKSDLATAHSRSKIEEQINELTYDTFLESAPVIYTSTQTGEGLDRVEAELDNLISKYSPKPPGDYFYLPIDRVFTIKGFGTIVTGTLKNGVIQVGDNVEIMPKGLSSQIRGIEVHNKNVDTAHPGERVAINLRHIEKQQLSKGDCVVSVNYLKPTRIINAELSVLNEVERIPSRNEPIKLLFGTTEVIAKYKTLDRKKLQAGCTSLIQFTITDEVVTPIDNLFVVRTCSPALTLGGGKIVENCPPKYFQSSKPNQLIIDKSDNKIYEKIELAGSCGISIDELGKSTAISLNKIKQQLEHLPVVVIGNLLLLTEVNFKYLRTAAVSHLKSFHKLKPYEIGVSTEELKNILPADVSSKVFRHLVSDLLKNNIIRTNNSKISLYKFNPLEALNQEQKSLLNEIETTIKKGRFKPAELKDVLGENEYSKKLYTLLKETGKLIEIKNHDLNRPIVFHHESIDEMISILKNLYPQPKLFTVSDVRKNLNTSRKYAVPLLEYLDIKKITIRDGDSRKILNTTTQYIVG